MLEFSDLGIEAEVANHSEAMEADTISKHGRSFTSQKGRGNQLISVKIGHKISRALFISILLLSVSISMSAQYNYIECEKTQESLQIRFYPF